VLDLRRLRLLRELHERGTIAAVADALQFTPSAVSQQLGILEREAGVQLLERAGRGVRLTDPALVLVGHAEALLARAALAEAAEFVRTRSRPWFESGTGHAADDPLTIQRFGELEVSVRAADALLGEAGRAVDRARERLDDETAAAASIAVATAKAFADPAAVEVSDALFEVSGTRSALDSLNLHRHWRNARTHTLHDPAAWKVQHLGRHALEGVLPPNHGQI